MSIGRASGQMPRMTPFIAPAKYPETPKSVSNVTMGFIGTLEENAVFLLRPQRDHACRAGGVARPHGNPGRRVRQRVQYPPFRAGGETAAGGCAPGHRRSR